MSEGLIIAILSSSSIATIVTAIINAIMNHSKSYKILVHADQLLMKDRIKHLGKSYIDRGWVTIEELEDFHEMHQCYHEELGGNGFLTALVNSVDALPTKPSNVA